MAVTDELFEVLKGEDDLGVVIRTHIHIEAVLNDLIEKIFRESKYVDKMGLDYHQKVKLTLACGLDPRFEKPLNTLGTIRNNFAHRLEAKLGKDREPQGQGSLRVKSNIPTFLHSLFKFPNGPAHCHVVYRKIFSNFSHRVSARIIGFRHRFDSGFIVFLIFG